MRIWHYFNKKGTPEYLAKHYWWAYIWRRGVWFFDHQPIISAILFGYYQRLLSTTLKVIGERDSERLLQVACVYGKLTPCIAQMNGSELHVIDVADIQLQETRSKLNANSTKKNRHHLVKMNAECLAYADNSFDTALIFFLLHEMPADARLRTLRETLRVLSANGRLIIVEYGELTHTHLLHRFFLMRYILGVLEPFLPEFWQENLVNTVNSCAVHVGKAVDSYSETKEFSHFYRVVRFTLTPVVNAEAASSEIE